MKNLLIIFFVVTLASGVFGQAQPEFSISEFIETNEQWYEESDPRFKRDTIFNIHVKEWNFTHLTDDVDINTADSIVRGYIELFGLEKGEQYKTMLQGKLIQFIEIGDSTYDYQEFVNEMNKYQLSCSGKYDFSFVVRDEFEMDIRTTYATSNSCITYDYGTSDAVEPYHIYGWISSGNNYKMEFNQKKNTAGEMVGEMTIFIFDDGEWVSNELIKLKPSDKPAGIFEERIERLKK